LDITFQGDWAAPPVIGYLDERFQLYDFAMTTLYASGIYSGMTHSDGSSGVSFSLVCGNNFPLTIDGSTCEVSLPEAGSYSLGLQGTYYLNSSDDQFGHATAFVQVSTADTVPEPASVGLIGLAAVPVLGFVKLFRAFRGISLDGSRRLRIYP
jgi:hypothetical protein